MNPRAIAHAFVVLTCAASIVAPTPHRARAETAAAKDPADALMKKMLDAVKANAYEAFVADGTPKLKTLNKGAFGLVSAHFGPLLAKGYKTTLLAKLRKPDNTIHLWKLEPAGAKEDFEIRMVLKDGKIDAFSIH
jgi:hypothetical protein